MRILRSTAPLAGLLLFAVVACGPKEPAKPKAPDTPQRKEALSYFKTVCSTCHGMEGHGDGAVSKTLAVKPRRYNDPEWKKTATLENIVKVIKGGGKAIGKSELMPPNPTLKDDVIQELAKYVLELSEK